VNKYLRRIYFPMTVPHPERIGNYAHLIKYHQVDAIAHGEVQAVRYKIVTPFPSLAGKRIVFVSDFHYQDTARDRRLAQLAASLADGFAPEVLIFGGDVCAHADDIGVMPQLLKLFRDIGQVRVAVPGNWERGKTWLKRGCWDKIYADAGFAFLSNQALIYDDLYLYGTDDLRGTPKLPEELLTGRFNILISHRPDTVVALDIRDRLQHFPLILCGHTHGGQVRFPMLGPVYASSSYGCKFDYGLFERRPFGSKMIVTSGVGNLSNILRFNCRREIVLIELENS